MTYHTKLAAATATLVAERARAAALPDRTRVDRDWPAPVWTFAGRDGFHGEWRPLARFHECECGPDFPWLLWVYHDLARVILLGRVGWPGWRAALGLSLPTMLAKVGDRRPSLIDATPETQVFVEHLAADAAKLVELGRAAWRQLWAESVR